MGSQNLSKANMTPKAITLNKNKKSIEIKYDNNSFLLLSSSFLRAHSPSAENRSKSSLDKTKNFEDKYKKDVENPREFSIAMDVIIRTLAYSTDICETAINLSYKEVKG